MCIAAPLRPEITGKLPGYLSPSAGLKFEDVPNGLAAISKVPAAGWAQILAYMAFCETSQDQSPGTAAAAGDFGFKVLTSSDPAEKTKKLAAGIANGRLAMMAIIGMLFQDGLTGSAWGDWALYTASPLRAVVHELHGQAPDGSFDSKGRLAMVAISGMLFQDGHADSALGDLALYTAFPLPATDSKLGMRAQHGYVDLSGSFDHAEGDEGPRARYSGRWDALMSDDEGDEVDGDDGREPLRAADGGDGGLGQGG